MPAAPGAGRPAAGAHRGGKRARSAARAAVLAIVVVLTVGLVAACGGDKPAPTPPPSGSHALTVDEANRLAKMRLVNYEGVGVRFHADITTEDADMTLVGYADYHRSLGYGVVTAEKRSDLLQWNKGTLAVWRGVSSTEPPAKLPVKSAGTRSLKRSGNPLDLVLQAVLALGADKPANAKALRESGALWLRQDSVDGVAVDVMTGPTPEGTTSSVQYWVDAQSRLLRMSLNLSDDATAEVDFDADGFHTFPEDSSLTD